MMVLKETAASSWRSSKERMDLSIADWLIDGLDWVVSCFGISKHEGFC